MKDLPKIRMKNSPFHKKDITITLYRYATGKVISKKSFDGWGGTYEEGLEIKSSYECTSYYMKDTFSYNKYGSINGWHPIDYDEFFDPYMYQIMQEARKMIAGETRKILVTRR